MQYELTKSVKGETEASKKTDEKKRLAAIQAFACAKLSLKNDPTVFISDCNEQNLTEIFYEAIINRDGKIPLSSLQLAMYHQIVVNSNMCPINISMKSVVKAKNVEELDKNCITVIREHRIHELVPLILELRLLKLYNESLDLIKTGDPSSWKKVDHLQFLLAMLRGHWGKNTLTVIREWATFHLMEIMDKCDKMDDEKLKHDADIHKYKLCCVCYALLCKHNFVRFVKPGEDHYKTEIIACTQFFGHNIIVPGSVWYESSDDIYCITSEGYISGTKYVIRTNLLPTPNGPYPNKGELPWEELFNNCDDMNGCANMWNGSSPEWEIKSALCVGQAYQYRQLDFQLAMATLNNFLRSSVTGSQCYGIKKFINRTNRDEGTMKCFPQPDFPDYEYTMYEMKVSMNTSYIDALARLFRKEGIGNNDINLKTREHQTNWQRMLGCRFVFCASNNPGGLNNKTGTLFYTDNHYGHNLIHCEHNTPDLLQVLLNNVHHCFYTQYIESCSNYITRKPNTSAKHKKKSLCGPCYDTMEKHQFDFNADSLAIINESNCEGSWGFT